jgi:hypothetical protein
MLNEGIEGIRTKKYFYAPEISTIDSGEAISLLPRNVVDVVKQLVQDWIISRVDKVKSLHVATISTQFLKQVANSFTQLFKDRLGIILVYQVKCTGIRLIESPEEVETIDEMENLCFNWVVKPRLNRSYKFTKEDALSVCDEGAALLRIVSAILLNFLGIYGYSMTIKIFYNYKDVMIDTSKIAVGKKPAISKDAPELIDRDDTIVHITKFPKVPATADLYKGIG